jgi:hypothetical protein
LRRVQTVRNEKVCSFDAVSACFRDFWVSPVYTVSIQVLTEGIGYEGRKSFTGFIPVRGLSRVLG